MGVGWGGGGEGQLSELLRGRLRDSQSAKKVRQGPLALGSHLSRVKKYRPLENP